MRSSRLKISLLILITAMTASTVFNQDRFPRPEFDSKYDKPLTQTPAADSLFTEYLDVTILAAALLLAAFLVLKKRSRNYIYILSLLSLFYFGFWREGCICPIGSVQNVTQAIFDPLYFISVSALLFFILPLLAALLFGRVFCSSVCPMGAIQELVLLKPVKVPSWIAAPLSLIPYLFLGLTILYTATGSGYITCQLDPFVAFFRLGGEFNMIVFGLLFLVLGIFVGRPYCRFLCPYGVVLGWMSKFSKNHLSITPDSCTQCRLCEESCPYDAIDYPVDAITPVVRQKTGRRILIITIMTGMLTLIGAGVGYLSSGNLSNLNPTIKLAEQVMLERSNPLIETTLASRTFHESGEELQDLLEETATIKSRFNLGGILLGIFMGLTIGLKSIGIFFKFNRVDYTANRTDCYSCGRCMPYCPDEHERQKILDTKKRLYESIG